MTSHVSSYYFPRFCAAAVAAEPKVAAVPTPGLIINDFELYSADYQPNIRQTAQSTANFQFVNNIPVTNAMTFASPISSLFSPPVATFDNQIEQTNTHFYHQNYPHFDYPQIQSIQNQSLLESFEFEQQLQNQLIQQYPNVKNAQLQETLTIDSTFCTNTNYGLQRDGNNENYINFSLDNKMALNCSNNLHTFFENNKNIKSLPINNSNYNNQNQLLSTLTGPNQMAFNSSIASSSFISSPKMSSSPNDLQCSSTLSVSSNCSTSEFQFSLALPVITTVDSLNCNTNNTICHNNSSEFCINNSFSSTSNNTIEVKKNQNKYSNINKTTIKKRVKIKTNKFEKMTNTYLKRQKTQSIVLNSVASSINVILPPEICAKVFYPPSAVNPQNHMRNSRQSRMELSQKRVHQCREPGKNKLRNKNC